MTTKIRVVFCAPNEAPRVVMLERDLASFQKLLGGFVEMIKVGNSDEDFRAYVDEDGLRKSLALNLALDRRVGVFAPVVGPAIIFRLRGSQEISLTHNEAADWLQRLQPAVTPPRKMQTIAAFKDEADARGCADGLLSTDHNLRGSNSRFVDVVQLEESSLSCGGRYTWHVRIESQRGEPTYAIAYCLGWVNAVKEGVVYT